MGGPLLQPLASWSDHTLPVSCLAVGAGDAGAIVVSGSHDRTVKIRSLAGGSGGLLRSVALPSPLHSLALDPGEHALYAGCASGSIYEVSLVGGPAADAAAEGGGGLEAAAAAAGGGCAHPALEGHSAAVSCLGFTPDAAYLISGSADHSVRVWELRSRQQVRLLANPVKGPVSALLALPQPPFMQVGPGAIGWWVGRESMPLSTHLCCRMLPRLPPCASCFHLAMAAATLPDLFPSPAAALLPQVGGSHAASSSSGGGGKRGPKRPQPLAPFCKYPNAPGTLKPWEGGLVLLDGSAGAADVAAGGDWLQRLAAADGSVWQAAGAAAPAGRQAAGGATPGAAAAAAAGAGGGSAADAAALQEENARLKEQLERALQTAEQWGQLNSQLQTLCTERLLGEGA